MWFYSHNTQGFKKFMIDIKNDNFVVLGVPSDDFNQELPNEKDVKIL